MNNLYLLTIDSWLGHDVIVIAPNEEEALRISSYLFSDEDKKLLKVFLIDMTRSRPLVKVAFGEEERSGYVESTIDPGIYIISDSLDLE